MGYAAFFDGSNLLSLNPTSFEEERKATLSKSLQNPVQFNKFFNLKSTFHKQQENIGIDNQNLKVMHLFDPQKVINHKPSRQTLIQAI